MHSLARISWFLGVVAALSWILVLVVVRYGLAFFDGEASPLAVVIAVAVTAVVVELPVRGFEKRRGEKALRIPSSDALLAEAPGFAGLVAVGATVAWWQDLGAAVWVSIFVSVWAIAAPLVIWSRHRASAAAS